MNVWKLAVPFVLGIASLGATGCAVQEEVEVQSPPRPVAVREAPPAADYATEVVPVAPRADYVWIKGHWHYNGARWIWLPGRYEAPRRGARWVPAHYEGRGGAYYYVPGHWARY
ncbi:lipoprotein, putative [Minicystis rosea]|nr:lipoprotein, putative [Minicystis rosea]